MTDMTEIINGIDTLAPIPAVAVEIMNLAEDRDCAAAEIADLILHDPAITANLLKICNSAFFGLVRKVDSVHDAITMLGLNEVVHLVLLTSAAANLSAPSKGYGLGEGELWRHAVISAHVARVLAGRNGDGCNQARIFTAALLKDIGKLILSRFVAFSLEKINILVHAQGFGFNEAEKEILGMSHEELGARVAQKWKFSEKMIYIIRHHHLADASARDDVDTAVVYLADIVCMMMGVGTGVDGLAYRFYSEVLDRMRLNEKDLQAVMAGIGENRQKIERLLDLV